MRGRDFEKGPAFRNIPDRALNLRCFVTKNDFGGLEYSLTRQLSFFFHANQPIVNASIVALK
jgi:hypothetical protein